ncbi:PREDICTED: proto-oncogene Mas-like [Gekko japonicus]|uniref:Proto-oncogene Mas-like n=1 Tax=Gekko japonicus TaxID=146911 RepID=A0ABM1JKM2_GEKJA|nr:PREDICTED: proto-oncogene Mas-like [Gekko japonicus]
MTKLSIITNISLTTLPMMDAALDHYYNPNYTYSSFPSDGINYENVSEEISSHNTTGNGREKSIVDNVVISISIWVICIFGAVGNGIVIWLLGFRIKRNPFSTYILNLAIADLGVLLSVTFIAVDLWIAFLYDFPIAFPVFLFLFLSTYSTSQFLLMAISIDRCVAVFFPLWHRCHRPPHLSTIVCALIWVLSFLLTTITYTLIYLNLHEREIEEYYQFIANALLCLPVMTIATLALFIKVCLKAQQHRKGKLLTIVLLTLLFFLLFASPLNVMFILHIFNYLPSYAFHGATVLACLNSSVNPAIYILVGRQGKSRQRENMKIVFQKVFKEEESCTEGTPVETQL